MNEIKELLISLFESLGLYKGANGLGEHLRGLDVRCNDFSNESYYSTVFLALFIVNTIIVLNYYYGLFNRVNFTNRFSWFMNILAGAGVVFIIAFLLPYNDVVSENFCSELKLKVTDCFGFAATAVIFSLLYSFLLSMLIKWKSSSNKKVPF